MTCADDYPAARAGRGAALALFAGLSFAACSAAPADASRCELRVAWDPYEPYSYADGNAAPRGYDIEVVRKVADITGCSLAFTRMAWGDILDALRAGEVDLTVGTGYHEERAAWSWYSDSYRNETVGLLVRAGTQERLRGGSLDELFRGGMVFGQTTDDTYEESTTAVFARYPEQVLGRVSESQNLERLLAGSIDAFLIEVNVAAALARKRGAAGDVTFHPLSFDAGAYRLQMSRQTVSAARVAEINAALRQLAESGWLARTLAAYGMQQ